MNEFGLKELKKGDVLKYFKYAGTITKVKVVANLINDKTLIVKIGLGFLLGSFKVPIRYSDENLKLSIKK